MSLAALSWPLIASAQAPAASSLTDAQRERLAQAAERFRAADTNHDGQISRAEADASLPRIAKRFDQLDADGNGQLSADEFREAMARARAQR
ncbi:EF-hand domain-containing protein [Stenotrophomonas sp. HITSZ_GD]|uniref:EF-hand domain-containing protein n=1 Tax=Stenotrophomonas sp. HITSZ_GD TaxID=3037248 RepID=UPI00240DD647|nr:EF-hand domain-containing protein [Stenotrophomonas sp. HITSZ_GD]MDG2525282.1 EF-hand domain-containing protein [Stenotrophomonas sp. HITSZ_GD]